MKTTRFCPKRGWVFVWFAYSLSFTSVPLCRAGWEEEVATPRGPAYYNRDIFAPTRRRILQESEETEVGVENDPSTSSGTQSDDDACTLCPDGSSVPGLPFKEPGYGLPGTCAEIDAWARETYTTSDAECAISRFVSGICACPPVNNQCTSFCDGKLGSELPKPDYVVQTLQQFGLPPMSCEDMALFATQFQPDDLACDLFFVTAYLCDCPAANAREANILQNLMRAGGAFSLFGSIFIVADVVRKQLRHATRQMPVFDELILCLSAYDIISSLSWALTAFPAPSENAYGEPLIARKYGGRGNDATCTAQGFFIQLGYTSLWYNLSLSIYYVIVFRYGWRELRIRKIARWFHLPSLLGIGLAFAGIPFYGFTYIVCWIPSPPFASTHWLRTGFSTLPVCTVIVLASINMVLVYQAVQKTYAAQDRWRISTYFRINRGIEGLSSSVTGSNTEAMTGTDDRTTSRSNSRAVSTVASQEQSPRRSSSSSSHAMSRAVFWQCVFYMGAFYITWPIQIIGAYTAQKDVMPFWFWCLDFLLSPMQGWWNFLVYARPRIMQYLRNQQNRRGSSSLLRSAEQTRAAVVLPSGRSRIRWVSSFLTLFGQNSQSPSSATEGGSSSGRERSRSSGNQNPPTLPTTERIDEELMEESQSPVSTEENEKDASPSTSSDLDDDKSMKEEVSSVANDESDGPK